ncbi:MAG TPA: hypothetical protein PL105_24650, partial [Caldilineaceae bacterium]|nr:hypothetical protein [Caldilineaceae bacterium]
MEKFAPLNLSPEEIVDYTPAWSGERFGDGRPKVADNILERMRLVTITEAWGILRGDGFHFQYAGDFLCTHPGQVLV